MIVVYFLCLLFFLGLSKLTNLKVLDLSNNMILYHETISAVGDMAFLKYLNLKYNPLAYVKNHREITCRYLHENAAVELVGYYKYIYDKNDILYNYLYTFLLL